MFTAEQHRARAAQYKGFLDTSRSPGETSEFRNLEQTHATLADNEDWLARNGEKILAASRHDIAPASEDDEDNPAASIKDEHVLRCLGAAVRTLWSTLPAELQRELVDQASTLEDFALGSSVGDLAQKADLKVRIARFLDSHNGGSAEIESLQR